jgi:hypothetical protein
VARLGSDEFSGTVPSRIATNVCFDLLNGRERRARPMDMGPAQEPVAENLNTSR